YRRQCSGYKGVTPSPASSARPAAMDLRGPAAVAAARPVVAVASDTAAASALPLCPAVSAALPGSCEWERHAHYHRGGVVLDDFGDAGRRRDGLAAFGHALDVQGERLPCPFDRFIKAVSGGDGAGEIRERDAVVGIGVLVDEGDVVLAHALSVLGEGK